MKSSHPAFCPLSLSIFHPLSTTVKAENTGIAGVYHNKGGIVVQFCVYQTRLTFLTAHLAAHEGGDKYKARNDNVREILRGARPNPKHLAALDAAVVSHHMFVMGDLNYRVRIQGAAAQDTHEARVAKALELVAAGDFEALYAMDELSQGLHRKDVLCQFQTLPCHFSPTFKMLRQEGFHYKEQRVPRCVVEAVRVGPPKSCLWNCRSIVCSNKKPNLFKKTCAREQLYGSHSVC